MIKNKIRNEILSRTKKEELKYGVIGAEIRSRRMKLSRTLASIVKEVCSISYLCKIEKNAIRANKQVLRELCSRVDLDEKATKSLLDIKNTLFKTVKAFKNNDIASLEILSDEVKIFRNYRSKLIIFIYCIHTKKFEKANLIDKDLLDVVGGMSQDDLKIYFCFHAVLEFYNQEFKNASDDLYEITRAYDLSEDLKIIVSEYKLYSDLKINNYKIVSSYKMAKELFISLGEYELLDKANYALAFYYLQNRDYFQYGKYYKMLKSHSYKYTLLILTKMIFNSKVEIKREWLSKARPIAVFIATYYKNPKVFDDKVKKISDIDFDFDFNPMIMEYLSNKKDLDKFNYINDIAARAIVASNDGSAVKFFLNQFSNLCYRHTKYKAFYEFYYKVKDLI